MRLRLPALLLLLTLAALLAAPTSAQSPAALDDDVKIAALLAELDAMSPAGLAVLPAREVVPYELPMPGVDVMRARLEETYTIDGIGQDTVELTGWIAVRHGRAQPTAGATEVTWNTAVVDTQFVGMDLSGHSDLFGDVHIRLDRSRPLPVGQVGQIEIPELAHHGLVAELRKDESLAGSRPPHHWGKKRADKKKKADKKKADKKSRRYGRSGGEGSKRSLASSVSVFGVSHESEVSPLTVDRVRELTPELFQSVDAGNCRAEVLVSVQMSDLGLEMKTSQPVLWYSLVDTIPPVGHTASIAIEPVRLTSEGREVGTLQSGVVKFREVVKWVALSDEPLRELPPSDRWAHHGGSSEGASR